MNRKTAVVNVLTIVLASAFLIGSLQMAVSESFMQMDGKTGSPMADFQINRVSQYYGDNPSGTCCDVLVSCAPACDFVATQLASVIVCGGCEEVVNSSPKVRLVQIKAESPPPKI